MYLSNFYRDKKSKDKKNIDNIYKYINIEPIRKEGENE